MLNTDHNFNRQFIISEEQRNMSSNQRAVLAMSRRNKLKETRNYKTSKGNSRLKFYHKNSSRRSNSVSSNRTGRSSSSRRSSSNHKFNREKFKSKSRIRGRKYIKNILPIMPNSEGGVRGQIAKRFDSASKIEHQLNRKLQS